MDPKLGQELSGKHSEDSGLSPQDLRALSPILRLVTLREEHTSVKEKLVSALTVGSFLNELFEAKFTPKDQLKVIDSIKSQRANYELEALVGEPSVVSNPPLTIGGWRTLIEEINLWAPKAFDRRPKSNNGPLSDTHPFANEVVTWVLTQFRRELFLWSAPDHTRAGWLVAAIRIQAPPEDKMEETLARKVLSLVAFSAFTHKYSEETPKSTLTSFVRPWLDHFLFGDVDHNLDPGNVEGIAKDLIGRGETPNTVVERLREVRGRIIERIDSIPFIVGSPPPRNLPDVNFVGMAKELDQTKKADDFLARLFDRCKDFTSTEKARIFSNLEVSCDVLSEYSSSGGQAAVLRDLSQGRALFEMWKWSELDNVDLVQFPLDIVTPKDRDDYQQFVRDLRVATDALLKLEPKKHLREGVDLLFHYIRTKLLISPG